MQFVVDSIAPPPAGETPQAALVRRGAHLVSAPEGHPLRRAVPHLFSVFNGHTVIAFNVIEGLLARVLRLPAAAPAPALARVGAGAVDLSVLESTLAILVAEPYSLSVEPVTSETFLRDVKELSSSARVRADARFVVTSANIYALGVPPPPAGRGRLGGAQWSQWRSRARRSSSSSSSSSSSGRGRGGGRCRSGGGAAATPGHAR